VVQGARRCREAVQQLADVRRRLEETEHALAEDATARKHAEEEYDAADDRFLEVQQELEEAMDQRAVTRRAGYAVRQKHEGPLPGVPSSAPRAGVV